MFLADLTSPGLQNFEKGAVLPNLPKDSRYVKDTLLFGTQGS